MLDEKLSITKLELNDEDIIYEPEINVEACNDTDVPVKSEIHSDNDETMNPADDDSLNANETMLDDSQIASTSDADGTASTPTKLSSRGRRVKKATKQSPESSSSKSPNKSSPKSKRTTVSQEKVHQCNKCDKIFNRATHLKRHMATHSDVKPYSCEICDKRFRRPDHLNIHRHHHSSIKPHVCDVCQKGFTRSEHLRKHKECRHGDKTQVTIKTEFCEICQVSGCQDERETMFFFELKINRNFSFFFFHFQKGFTTPKYLQVHMKSHTDRTFACKFCEDKFGTKAELNEHQKTHVNER